MTIQLTSQRFGKSKATLQEAMNTTPNQVAFEDPSIFSPRSFVAADIRQGEKFAAVLDHPKRMRFATIARKPDGTFRVS